MPWDVGNLWFFTEIESQDPDGGVVGEFGGLLATGLQNNWEFIWFTAIECKLGKGWLEGVEVYNFWKFLILHEDMCMSVHD